MFDFPNNPVVNQSVTAPNGGFFIFDGVKWTNGAGPAPTLYIPISGGVMTGPLTLAANATQPMHAVPLQQINTAAAGGPFLPTAGGTVGYLSVNAATDNAFYLTTSNATRAGQQAGFNVSSSNTGSNSVNAHKFTYFSSSNGAGFDIGLTSLAIFDPSPYVAGANPTYEGSWIVAVSPNDTTHNWACNVAEWNIVNRGADMGWKRDRTSANPTGGLLLVPEVATFAGSGGGQGVNASFAFSVGHSGGNNSTGFPAKFYNGYLVEPNGVVGLTGRAIYVTGDITGTASQYPYGPLQTDGTWLHGIDHTLATYQDGHAQTMLAGQGLAWITGTTTAPTGTVTLSGDGTNLLVTGNLSAYGVEIGNGHPGAIPATAYGGAIVWDLSNGGGEINFFNAFTAASPNSFTWNQVTSAGVQTQLAGLTNAGALRLTSGLATFGAAPITTKPTVTGAKGSNAALASLLAALASYGLVADSTTA